MTPPSGQVPALCATPIDFAVLMDYWRALLSADDEAAVEEARLLAVDDAGGERLLGEYRLEHTRTIPGPPGWEW